MELLARLFNTAPSDLREQIMWRDPSWCRNGCLGLSEWNSLVPDGVLRGAIIVAYHHNPDLRPYAHEAAVRRTRVHWAKLPAGVGGRCDRDNRTITMNVSLRGESTGVLAAMLAHELIHACQAHCRNPAGCIADEMVAYAWQADTWSKVRRQGPRSSTARMLDDILGAWRQSVLRSYVLALPIYHRQCMGGDLPDF